MSQDTTRPDDLRKVIKHYYADAARSAARPSTDPPCCGDSGCCGTPHYDLDTLRGIPRGAIAASRGCGNPHAMLELAPGEVVLDLGSGGGIDALLAARRVGPSGFVYGLDLTDEMLELARTNQQRSRLENVEFLKGDMESIPLPDASVDVVISNCVINLAADKDRVLREAVRVLRPGGRFAIYDTLFQGDAALVPEALRTSSEAWACCVAGALEEHDYLRRLAAAGLIDLSLAVTQSHGEGLPDGVRLASGFIRGRKPAGAGPVEFGSGATATETEVAAFGRLLRENRLPIPEAIDDHFVLARTEGGRVVAGAGLEVHGEGRIGLLRSVVVDSPYRGRGIAEAMVRDRLAWAEAHGITGIYLLTETAADWFTRLGFGRVDRSEAPQPIQRSDEFRELCSSSSILMRLKS